MATYKLTFNANGGTLGTAAVWYDTTTAKYYTDSGKTTAVTSITKPTRTGYIFAGFFNTATGTTQYVKADGTFGTTTPTGSRTVYAQWTARSFTLSFNAAGGTAAASKTVTYGETIGTLPTTTRDRYALKMWTLDGNGITESTVWTKTSNATAVAEWYWLFGNVVDYFNLQSDALIPTMSTNGDNKQRICVAHTGRYEPGVGNTSGIWRNPSVTYVVAKNTTVNVTLGSAFAGGENLSGYMIVSVTVETQVGQFPTVTVEAVANEGANAINQFAVSIPVVARSKAQNLLGAVNGGGNLNACTIRASCAPVVIAENMMPCASDVVHGRMEATATTIAANGENAPTAGGGFTSIGEPKQQNEASYTVYTLNAQKEIA